MEIIKKYKKKIIGRTYQCPNYLIFYTNPFIDTCFVIVLYYVCVLTKEGTNHYCLGLWGYLPGSTMHTHTHTHKIHKQTNEQLKTHN